VPFLPRLSPPVLLADITNQSQHAFLLSTDAASASELPLDGDMGSLFSVWKFGKCRKKDSVLKTQGMILFGNLPAWRDIIYLPGNGFSSRPECCHQPHNIWAGRPGDLKEI